MQVQQPLTFTVRLQNRPLCPICTRPLLGIATIFIRGYALCVDCWEHRHLDVEPTVRLLELGLLANCMSCTQGLKWWHPPNGVREDAFTAFATYVDRESVRAQIRNRPWIPPAEPPVSPV